MAEHDLIKVTLPDGSVREYPAGVSMLEIAKDISPRLAREALAAKVDGRLVNLSAPLDRDARVEILTFDDEEGRQVYRHQHGPRHGPGGAEAFSGHRTGYRAGHRRRVLLRF